MQLNELKPAAGSRKNKKRVGRGPGSGLGKTAGRGVKGQKARSGGKVRPGFEGGQMPLQRRLPKFGFTSLKARDLVSVRLDSCAAIEGDVVTLDSLEKANVIKRGYKRVKVFLAGEVSRALTFNGVSVSKGARAAIEAAGGKIEG